MTRIAVIVGSTRPHRNGALVAAWVQREAERLIAAGEIEAEVEVVDLAEMDLPLLDEPLPAITGEYRHEHTRRWSRVVAGFDGFVFCVGEYNKSFPAALKNAVDFLYHEWTDKAAGLVGYGMAGGQRAVEQLRLVLSEVHVATVGAQVGLAVGDHIDDEVPACTPDDLQHELLRRTLAEVVAWSAALRPLRGADPVAAAVP